MPRERWYVRTAQGQDGPLTARQISLRMSNGELDWTSEIWREGLSSYRPARRDELLVLAVAGVRGLAGATMRLESTDALLNSSDTRIEAAPEGLRDSRTSDSRTSDAGEAPTYVPGSRPSAPPAPPSLAPRTRNETLLEARPSRLLDGVGTLLEAPTRPSHAPPRSVPPPVPARRASMPPAPPQSRSVPPPVPPAALKSVPPAFHRSSAPPRPPSSYAPGRMPPIDRGGSLPAFESSSASQQRSHSYDRASALPAYGAVAQPVSAMERATAPLSGYRVTPGVPLSSFGSHSLSSSGVSNTLGDYPGRASAVPQPAPIAIGSLDHPGVASSFPPVPPEMLSQSASHYTGTSGSVSSPISPMSPLTVPASVPPGPSAMARASLPPTELTLITSAGRQRRRGSMLWFAVAAFVSGAFAAIGPTRMLELERAVELALGIPQPKPVVQPNPAEPATPSDATAALLDRAKITLALPSSEPMAEAPGAAAATVAPAPPSAPMAAPPSEAQPLPASVVPEDRATPSPAELQGELARLGAQVERCVPHPERGLSLQLTLAGDSGRVRKLSATGLGLYPGARECLNEAFVDFHVAPFRDETAQFKHRYTW